MAKQPHNEHELELALTRLSGSNIAAVGIVGTHPTEVLENKATARVGNRLF